MAGAGRNKPVKIGRPCLRILISLYDGINSGKVKLCDDDLKTQKKGPKGIKVVAGVDRRWNFSHRDKLISNFVSA